MDLEACRRYNTALNNLNSLARKGHLSSVDFLVLSALHSGAARTPADIVSGTGLSASQISRRLRALVSLDLVSEEIDGKDLRRYSIAVTPKSRNILHEVRKALGAEEGDALEFQRALMGMRSAIAKARGVNLGYIPLRILFALHAAHADLSIGELSKICGISQSSVSCAAAALESHGMVRRHRPTSGNASCPNARFVFVTLSGDMETPITAIEYTVQTRMCNQREGS